MKKWFNLFSTDIKRACFSWVFGLCIIGETLFLCAVSLAESMRPETDVISMLDLGYSSGSNFIFLLCLLPLFPFAFSFAREWQDRATQMWMIRTGVSKYVISKMLAAAISGFLTVFLGMSLFVIVQSFFHPIHNNGLSAIATVYAETFREKPWWYLFIYITHLSTAGMLMATIALWTSAWIPNSYVTAIAPLVIYNVVLRIMEASDIPIMFMPTYLVESVGNGMSWYMVYILRWGISIGLCVLMVCNSVWKIRQRVNHD